MSGLKKLFCQHPESVNETYFEHLLFATGFGGRMIVAALACMVHGFFPFLFKTTGSECIRGLNQHLNECGRSKSTAQVDSNQVAQN
ncbi:MAG: DUF6356 family protein [Rhodospirillaceae bacterium]